jgi:hypothetical protein
MYYPHEVFVYAAIFLFVGNFYSTNWNLFNFTPKKANMKLFVVTLFLHPLGMNFDGM